MVLWLGTRGMGSTGTIQKIEAVAKASFWPTIDLPYPKEELSFRLD